MRSDFLDQSGGSPDYRVSNLLWICAMQPHSVSRFYSTENLNHMDPVRLLPVSSATSTNTTCYMSSRSTGQDRDYATTPTTAGSYVLVLDVDRPQEAINIFTVGPSPVLCSTPVPGEYFLPTKLYCMCAMITPVLIDCYICDN
ncbi:unnamed protein product [Protopolystoma xenopodis]|uniref:Uncharacterized protein n=1 Tax=Protopolystoma xenopodis TaxID=117903 RepID=A0A448WT21_9PLAT|nr:unnamed protein product [Protopolystoma xenopodis]